MLAGLMLTFDLSDWERWAIPLVGLASAGLTLLMGRALLRRRHRSLPAPTPRHSHFTRDPFLFGSPTEKRSSVRRSGKPIKVLISDAKALAKPVQGWIMDRSMGGLCVAVPEPVPEHTVLSLRTIDAPVEVPWVQVEIRRCESKGDRYELGCQFVRTPSWSVLLLFG